MKFPRTIILTINVAQDAQYTLTESENKYETIARKLATVEAEAERSNERAENVESKFIDIEDELKVSVDNLNIKNTYIYNILFLPITSSLKRNSTPEDYSIPPPPSLTKPHKIIQQNSKELSSEKI